MEKTNYNKTPEEYDKFIDNVIDKMKKTISTSKYDFSCQVIDFYCGKGGCFELVKHFINNNVGNTIDISKILPYPVWNIKYVTILNYLNNLSKCGYIQKTNSNKQCFVFIVKMIIEDDFKSTIFSNKEKFKKLIRRNKLRELV